MNISNFPKYKKHQLLTLPAGYHARPATLNDLVGAVAMFNAVSLRDEGYEQHTVARIRAEWTNPVFDLAQNTVIVTAPDRTVAAYAEVWTKPAEIVYLWGRVHPDHENLGLGTYLMEWGERRTHDNMVHAEDGARVVIHAFYTSDHQPSEQLFMDCGFMPIRKAYRMRIDFDTAPASANLPDGYSFRTFRYPDDAAALVKADLEIFRDHWGFIEPDFDETVSELRHDFETDPHLIPALSFFVIHEETGEIAGMALNRRERSLYPDAGYVNVLGVKREHRQQGLGSAILRESFYRLHQAGKGAVMLGVDAENLTGALHLYQKNGMRVYHASTIYEKELRSGHSRMTVDAETT